MINGCSLSEHATKFSLQRKKAKPLLTQNNIWPSVSSKASAKKSNTSIPETTKKPRIFIRGFALFYDKTDLSVER
ncbi:hypothetical protein AD954_05875 [Acetobacter cerevisiae]|uniref:Uncharacterized protein n=2 Tax=Acetobacter cerevisiae TaxID=178900 RepID=A0A149VC75_9PROT|nr:hypothetical protein AD954_05875 [Acetobacter cerevisiae]